MKAFYLRNFRKGLATNSSSTHSVIYKNKGDIFKDLNVFEENYYDRYTRTIAATKSAKIKYILTQIYEDEKLVEMMSFRYPEMKQYYPLIHKQLVSKQYNKYMFEDAEVFGSYQRGEMVTLSDKYVNFDYDTLCKIIDTDDIVIVGGSDESDFFYDTIKGHKEMNNADMARYDYYDTENPIVKNGNYYYKIDVSAPKDGMFWAKCRLSLDYNEKLIPEFPELIDLKITDKCPYNCSFCYQNATMNGKDANINYLRHIISTLPNKIEFSIGGGAVTEYGQLGTLFSYMKKKNHIVNVTLKSLEVEKLKKDDNLRTIFNKYVDGIGISIVNADELKYWDELCNMFSNKGLFHEHNKYIVIHLIPEMIGIEGITEIYNKIKSISEQDGKSTNSINILLLGYKTIGRGKNGNFTKFTKDELTKLLSFKPFSFAIDTTFANRYKDYFTVTDNAVMSSNNLTITFNEGEFSMYIDGVNETAYKSSYQLDKPYPMSDKYYDNNEIMKSTFGSIRRDGGFEVFKHKSIYETKKNKNK